MEDGILKYWNGGRKNQSPDNKFTNSPDGMDGRWNIGMME
jgi:hypothetical protein